MEFTTSNMRAMAQLYSVETDTHQMLIQSADEIDRQKREIDDLQQKIKIMDAENKWDQEKRLKYEEALEKYADRNNWSKAIGDDDDVPCDWWLQDGDVWGVADAALEK